MDFEQVLKEVVWRLVTEGRISYRRIKLSFALDDDGLEELRSELIGIKRAAADVDGERLVLASEGRLARPEGTALSQPLPALRLAERPPAPAIERELPAAAPVAPAAVAAAPEAERRQLTVMFCDLVGSTALSTGMDPEDLRDVIASYQSGCSAAIRRYDGFVAKFMGDGILVYFGYPRAHEDEAERSVRAGLDIVDAMAELNAAVLRPPGVELAVRIGIATGPVIVGDQIGEGTASETAVVGETPNLAARLQALAQPNQIVLRRHARCSAITSTSRISGHLTSRGLPSRCRRGASCRRGMPRAGLPQPGPGARHPSSDARRRWGCYCGLGKAVAKAAARSC
ncbi:MAG TPA: adenylate/guanylate cyclase domain-containing protein [Stellaceae bacterium]|nr:adenylate/guanylate cyclase domain-containing protein [Stellaceae bacterium]